MSNFMTFTTQSISFAALGAVLSVAGCLCCFRTLFFWTKESWIRRRGERTIARINNKYVSFIEQEEDTQRCAVSIQYIAIDNRNQKFFGQKTFKFVNSNLYQDLEIDSVTTIRYSRHNVQADPIWEVDSSPIQTLLRVGQVIVGTLFFVANHGVVINGPGWSLWYILFDIGFTIVYFVIMILIWKLITARYLNSEKPPKCIPLDDADQNEVKDFQAVMNENGWYMQENGTFKHQHPAKASGQFFPDDVKAIEMEAAKDGKVEDSVQDDAQESLQNRKESVENVEPIVEENQKGTTI